MINDSSRAAILALLGSVVSGLQLFGIVDWTSDQIAVLNLIVSNALVVTALVVKKGQAAG